MTPTCGAALGHGRARRRDAAARPGVPLIPNGWLGLLPEHAVICDLVVDPYLLDAEPPTVRGIEGIPQGNLDRYVFRRRSGVGPVPPASRRAPSGGGSCYSWPGVHPSDAWSCTAGSSRRSSRRSWSAAGSPGSGPTASSTSGRSPAGAFVPGLVPCPWGSSLAHREAEMRTPARADHPPSEASRGREGRGRPGGDGSSDAASLVTQAPGPSALERGRIGMKGFGSKGVARCSRGSRWPSMVPSPRSALFRWPPTSPRSTGRR